MLALLGTQWPALGVSYVEIGPLLAELPRGDIYLFNTIRLGFVLAFFLACVKTLAWLDADADRSGMPRPFWNLVFFSCATTSVALFFVLPAVGLDVVLMLFLYLGPLSVYILQRNLRVPPAMRLFTVGHFQRLLGGKAASDVDLDQGKESGKKGGAKAGKKASKKNAEKGGDSADENENEEDENMPAKVIPPIRFISRDRPRLAHYRNPSADRREMPIGRPHPKNRPRAEDQRRKRLNRCRRSTSLSRSHACRSTAGRNIPPCTGALRRRASACRSRS